jgi:transcription-repair coupling factor (superfamily II helicase)
VTEVIPYNERRIAQAIARELGREGQVYFVHNRVSDIKSGRRRRAGWRPRRGS